MATGDFNRDGKLDWVVSNGGDNSVYVYLGSGDGTAQLPSIINLTGLAPVSVASEDLNGDGNPDLAVAEADSDTVGILFGNGDGTFQPETQILFPTAPLAVRLADVDKDGHFDLMVGLAGAPAKNTRFAVLLNNGSGHFGTPIYAPNPTPMQIVQGQSFSFADANGDGKPDVLVTGADASGTTVQLYLGEGNGTFTAGQVVDYSINGFDRFVFNAALADVNGDGCPDTVDVDTLGDAIVYSGDCKGNFDTTNYQLYGMGDPGYGLAVADLNGDGRVDLITGGIPDDLPGHGNATGDTIGVRLNDGSGHLGPLRVYRGDPAIFSLIPADLAGNGRPEVITANQDNNSTTVYLNDGTGGFGEPQGGYLGYFEGPLLGGAPNVPASQTVVADINGDGQPDLGVVEIPNPSDNNLETTVMLNQGNSQFSLPIRSPLISYNPFYRVADFLFGDFRKSGSLDLVAEVFDNSGQTSPHLLYARNLGNGQFAPAQEIAFPVQDTEAFGVLAAGDFNNDGNLDFAIASATGPLSATEQLAVYLGHGDGTFAQSYQVAFGPARGGATVLPSAIFVGDNNGDGKKDIFVWLADNQYPGSEPLYEFKGNGNGTLQTPQIVITNLTTMTMVDTNHDGRLDVIGFESQADAGSPPGTAPATIDVYLANADGSFAPPSVYSPYPGFFNTRFTNNVTLTMTDPFVGDFNGDGNPDIAVYQEESLDPELGYVQFLAGNGDGTFTPTYDVFRLGTHRVPESTFPNVLGDGRSAFVESTNLVSSYQILRAVNAPSFQVEPVETPEMNGQGALEVTLNVPSSLSTDISLTASDPGIQVPASVTIPAGEISVQVPFTLNGAVPNRWFSVTAQANGETQVARDFPSRAGLDSFSFSVAPAFPDSVVQGKMSQGWTVSVQSNGAAAATFEISCQGLPAGLTCEFLDNLPSQSAQVMGGGMEQVSFGIAAAIDIPPGEYTFSILATDGIATFTSPQQIEVLASPPPLSADPNSVTWGAIPVGTTSVMQTILVVNSSSQDITSLSITGPANASPTAGTFQQTNNCSGGIRASLSCTFSVSFSATHTGTQTDQITVTTPSQTLVISLTAVAGDFVIQAAPGSPSSQTVKAGQAASFSLQAVPVSLQGGVNFACSGAPAKSQCSLNPTGAAFDGSTAVPIQVSITTTASSAVLSPYVPPPLRDPLRVVRILFGFGICLSLWFAFAAKRRGEPAAWKYATPLALALLGGVLFLVSCGGGAAGGGGGGGGNTGTPPGIYSIVVTASFQGTTRTATLSLTVN